LLFAGSIAALSVLFQLTARKSNMPTEPFTFSIRRAGETDAREAFGLIEEYYEDVEVIAKDNRADLEHYLAHEQSGIWLAWRAANPHATPSQPEIAVGCILLRPMPRETSAGEIKRLYVRKAYRGHGVAKALLLALEQYARSRGTQWLYLDSKDDLQTAIAFYRRSGYQPCERYNDNPQATIFMRKQLVRPDK
jgi:GNAT superfamily N-acetyltransferase